jgi:hypothetical protein
MLKAFAVKVMEDAPFASKRGARAVLPCQNLDVLCILDRDYCIKMVAFWLFNVVYARTVIEREHLQRPFVQTSIPTGGPPDLRLAGDKTRRIPHPSIKGRSPLQSRPMIISSCSLLGFDARGMSYRIVCLNMFRPAALL